MDPKVNNQLLKKKKGGGDHSRNVKLTRYLMAF